MAGQGAGPSRRSHTKSRKGCKTCKRRHIRCDETYPQCRNCTKHQVRCDYMETMGSDTQSQGSPEQPHIAFSPGSEGKIDMWQQTGSFPYPDLQVFPPPQTHEYSKTELHLIHHLSSISNDLLLTGSTNLTIWTQNLPKFLSIAASYPYVMHALLSFSANHLAWLQSSDETRNLHIQHGSVALRGLHEAIGNFSQSNADAILAASLLMLWQATDWRSWSSLRAGIQSVLAAMQSWRHQSLFAELIAEEDLTANSFLNARRRSSVNSDERTVIYQNVCQSLQRLQVSLAGNDMEVHWVGQLLAYIYRLQGSAPAQTPEDQFSHAYLLRKWMFWLPISLLRRQGGKGPAMLVLAHLYATAIALEPLFPDLGPTFSAALALAPLEEIISVTNAMQTEQRMGSASTEIGSMMQFPQQTAYSYRTRAMQAHAGMAQQDTAFLSVSPDLSYTSIGNLSPAFAPSTPHYPSNQTLSTPASASSSAAATYPFLEVPTAHAGFSYGTSSWGAMPSPGFPPQGYAEEAQYDYVNMSPLGGFRSGFVPPTSIWT